MSKAVLRALASAPGRGVRGSATLSTAVDSFTLPDLQYDYGELAPHISARIMELHHSKHHQTYVNNLNVAAAKYAEAEAAGDVATCVALQPAIKFNGGGHINHTMFWENLAPAGKGGGGEPEGDLAARIADQWGSFDAFKKEFNASTAAVQGSGWGWLGYDKDADRLVIFTCPNQDPPSTTKFAPLLGIDVWEHAYYLDYGPSRPDYLTEIWEVVNFNTVSERLTAAAAK